MKVFGVVYLIWNTVNGKKYVGQTIKTVEMRFNEHARQNGIIGRAIRKYGKENFRYGIIKSCASKDEMDYWEKYFIAALKSKKPSGYNQTDGGEGIVGLKRTPEHNAKIAAANKGKKRTPEQRANISAAKKGTTLSLEHCAKIGETLRDVKKTLEHCSHISAGQRGKSPYKNLITEIDKLQLTYAKLSKLLRLPPQTVSEKMRGNQNFTISQIDKLVEFFGKPKEHLFARDDGLPITLSKYYKTHYKNLLNEMEKRNLTYKALAKILGFTRQTFSNKMLGKKNFTERDKAKLVEIFGKPIEYLMFKEEFL